MKEIIRIWLAAQIFIVPFIVIDDEIFGLFIDFAVLFLSLVMYLGLKLIGV